MTPKLHASPTNSAASDRHLAAEVKSLLASGDRVGACERFEELVGRHQRRAAGIAYSYLRDPFDVDEAVQDAFAKAFLHLPSFREEFLFELWFTKIVVNGCLDRLKARKRRLRWLVPVENHEHAVAHHADSAPSPEHRLLTHEREMRLRAAISRLPERQRTVVILSQLQGYTTRNVSQVLGLSEATVRVHLFRAIRSLRKRLSRQSWLGRLPSSGRGAI